MHGVIANWSRTHYKTRRPCCRREPRDAGVIFQDGGRLPS